MEIYPSSMDHINADINELCSKGIYLRFADGQVRCSRAFYHLQVMDGQEVGAALMCDVNQCLVCTCPHSELETVNTVAINLAMIFSGKHAHRYRLEFSKITSRNLEGDATMYEEIKHNRDSGKNTASLSLNWRT
jgi:hypothetical protein